VLEGDPGNWAAVAGAISGRVRELGWRQRELADRSHVLANGQQRLTLGPESAGDTAALVSAYMA